MNRRCHGVFTGRGDLRPICLVAWRDEQPIARVAGVDCCDDQHLGLPVLICTRSNLFWGAGVRSNRQYRVDKQSIVYENENAVHA